MKSTSFLVPASAKSWLDVTPGSDFPIQNIPFGFAAPKGRPEAMVTIIGDTVIDLVTLHELGFFSDDIPYPDSFLEFDREVLSKFRAEIYSLFESENEILRDNKTARKKAFLRVDEANLQVPIAPNAFVDFYSGIHHASNVGKMFRPDQPPLLPNYRHLPIGYNGRASSVVVSGTPIIRPKGQTKGANDEMPAFGPTKEMDFELEMGFYVGHGNEMGKRITTSAAEDHMLGLVIVNDWSARDVQRWEYQPLGPFLSKSFATTVSPWIVTLDALEPFRIEGMAQDPAVLPHLRNHGKPHFEIELEVWLRTPGMKKAHKICSSNMKHLYWSIAQQLAHQTSNGTPVEFGDLYASGTISGDETGSYGSMLELSWRGSQPVELPGGETRTFLEDGDEVTLTAFAQGDGFRVGFGKCRGVISAAKE